MIENQDVEFKKIWKDEWLEWICGFANTTGGVLYIGVDVHRPRYSATTAIHIAIKNIFILFYHNFTHHAKISIFQILPQNTTGFPETKA